MIFNHTLSVCLKVAGNKVHRLYPNHPIWSYSMKNTNKSDDLDKYTVTPPPAQNDHQEPGSLSKRRIIASIGLTSGVLGATALSQNWVKPAVSSVILPAHAQTTGATATQPPATQPPATQPPATQPPATQPPATQPPATQPPATQPPATQPPATQPPADPNRFEVGDTVTGIPTQGIWSPSSVATGAGAGFVFSEGSVTLSWRDNSPDAVIEHEGQMYTCSTASGCEVVDGVVTKGTIVRS